MPRSTYDRIEAVFHELDAILKGPLSEMELQAIHTFCTAVRSTTEKVMQRNGIKVPE